jgi:putative intracellular protease/amidase
MAILDFCHCDFLCFPSSLGVHLGSFMQAITLTASAFSLSIATPGGQPIKFSDADDVSENTRRWLAEFSARPLSKPLRLEDVDPSRFITLLLPSGMGSLYDLHDHAHLGKILAHFISAQKPMCAIGYGVAGLCSSFADELKKKWSFRTFSLTAPSISEMSQLSDFGDFPVIPADFIRQHGGNYSSGSVVIDQKNLITGHNEQSTLTAVQNLVLLSNTWQPKTPK